MCSLTIEPGTILHIPEIICIQEVTWPATYGKILSPDQLHYMFEAHYSPEALRGQMEENGHWFLMLSHEGHYKGFASFSAPGEEGYGKLHKLYVLPGLRGSGAGRRLMDAVEAGARQQGGNELRLNVNRHNPARTFYEKMGYQLLYEEDIPIGPYWMNDYVMGKTLA